MASHPDYGPENLAREFNVSRETIRQLELYAYELIRWQDKINLVGPETLAQVWRRHMLDSAQLVNFIPGDARRIVDMGSGAGFPGLVIAALLGGVTGLEVCLVEAHVRKSAFLKHILALTGIRATIYNQRLELLRLDPVDVVTSRAMAPVGDLLAYAEPFVAGHTRCVFLKGQNVVSELTNASKCWTITATQHPSRSDSTGTVLVIKDFERVRDQKGG